jgi:hypothetical protein
LAVWEVDAMETRYSPEAQIDLKTILRLGPEVGVHVIGWWRSIPRLAKLLGGNRPIAPDDLGAVAMCDVIGSELGLIIPDRVAVGWAPRRGRGSFYDRRDADGLQLFMIPTLGGE